MSVLRHQLSKSIGNKKSGKGTTKEEKKYKGLKISEYIEKKDPDHTFFKRQLTVMIGCVSPRSLAVKFKDDIIQI